MVTEQRTNLYTYLFPLDRADGRRAARYFRSAMCSGANSGILPAIESAVAGRKVGERIEISLSPEEGYGLRDESLVFVDDIENVRPEFRRVGAEVMFENEAGETKVFYVTSIEDGKLTLDGNPSLAGQSVTCLVNVMDIRDATPEEIRNGRPLDVKTGTVH